MMLYGYGCPNCGARNPTTTGAVVRDGPLQVKCRVCGAVEKIRRNVRAVVKAHV